MVITDRYLDSSLAYQAGGRELTPEEIRSLSMWATNNLLPDRTYLLDMDPALSHHRLEHAEDRMESAPGGPQISHDWVIWLGSPCAIRLSMSITGFWPTSESHTLMRAP